ncbi:GIDE domain-containing protein [Streptomyces sp. NPDC059740]|uniref:GIDE domain-containing protein n=1 Tax=Streptomyces sp. NPDC059740 TaxID=3346926 RepID=UPI00364CEFFF
MSEASSMTDFAVADATGQVAVSPGDGEVVGAEKVLDRFERQLPDEGGVLQLGPLRLQLPSRERTLGFRQEEWVVRPGSFFYVHGAASDDRGRLVMAEPAGGGVFVMSVRTEEELLRAERNRSRYFWISGSVLAVGGVVSLVVGLVS